MGSKRKQKKWFYWPDNDDGVNTQMFLENLYGRVMDVLKTSFKPFQLLMGSKRKQKNGFIDLIMMMV